METDGRPVAGRPIYIRSPSQSGWTGIRRRRRRGASSHHGRRKGPAAVLPPPTATFWRSARRHRKTTHQIFSGPCACGPPVTQEQAARALDHRVEERVRNTPTSALAGWPDRVEVDVLATFFVTKGRTAGDRRIGNARHGGRGYRSDSSSRRSARGFAPPTFDDDAACCEARICSYWQSPAAFAPP